LDLVQFTGEDSCTNFGPTSSSWTAATNNIISESSEGISTISSIGLLFGAIQEYENKFDTTNDMFSYGDNTITNSANSLFLSDSRGITRASVANTAELSYSGNNANQKVISFNTTDDRAANIPPHFVRNGNSLIIPFKKETNGPAGPALPPEPGVPPPPAAPTDPPLPALLDFINGVTVQTYTYAGVKCVGPSVDSWNAQYGAFVDTTPDGISTANIIGILLQTVKELNAKVNLLGNV
jgi:hypothetical protein